MSREVQIQPGGHGELRQAVMTFRKAERARDEAIFRAHLGGSSLRAIALSTGLSHETIRGIVERMREWAENEQAALGRAADASMAMPVLSRIRSEKNAKRRQRDLDRLLSVNDPDSS